MHIIFIHSAFYVLNRRLHQDAYIATTHPGRSDRQHLAVIQGWQSVPLIPLCRGTVMSALPFLPHLHPLLVEIQRERYGMNSVLFQSSMSQFSTSTFLEQELDFCNFNKYNFKW